jgi:hypothetical protein
MYKFLVLQVTIYGSDFSLPQTGSLAKKSIFPARPCLYLAGGTRRAPISSQIVSYASANRGPVFQFAGVTSGVSSNVRCIFFRFFSLNFCFTSIFSLNFRLFFLRFRFRFLVFHIEVNHVKSGFFFASKRNEIFASISNFASKANVRAHPIWYITTL